MSNSESSPEDNSEKTEQEQQQRPFGKTAFALRYSDTTGCLLPFLVALLVGCIFGFSQGTIQSAISRAFSTAISQLNQMEPPTSQK